MAPRKNAKGGGGNSSSSGGGSSGSSSTGSSGGSSSSGARRETKHGGHKNGRKGGLSGSSFFTWFMVIALLGVWASVAVVWFDLVDYEEVLGKLGVYDADGDGDFDVDDAKVLLGLKERSVSESSFPPEEAEPHDEPEDQAPVGTEPQNIEDEIKEQIQSLLHETVHTDHDDLQLEADGPAGEPQPEYDDVLTANDIDDRVQNLEPGTFYEETEDRFSIEETVSQDHHQDMEEMMYNQEIPVPSEPAADDDRLSPTTDDVPLYKDEPVYEPSENEKIEISDNVIEDSNVVQEEVSALPVEEDQQEVPPDT